MHPEPTVVPMTGCDTQSTYTSAVYTRYDPEAPMGVKHAKRRVLIDQKAPPATCDSTEWYHAQNIQNPNHCQRRALISKFARKYQVIISFGVCSLQELSLCQSENKWCKRKEKYNE